MQVDQEKAAIIDQIMYAVAEELGDITELAMQRYYERFPDAEAVFERLSVGDRLRLEGQMVENTLFCFMRWFESPFEVRVLVVESLQHHAETLEIMSQWYTELIDVVAGIVRETIPEANSGQREVFDEVCTALHQIMNEAIAETRQRTTVK